MSGTSLDGVDIAYCEFEKTGEKWTFKIPFAETIPYTDRWKNLLSNVMHGSAAELAALHCEAGRYYASCINNFMQQNKIQPHFIASHGHTVFHQPDKKFTLQIGDGATLAALTGFDVICDFRAKDIALGGQGAPLVPVGDALLFSDYRFCLNLGGIANITVTDELVAFDVCPANMPLNDLVASENLACDMDGRIAKSGNTDASLLHKLNALSYYRQKYPKSLGREWYEAEFSPLIKNNLPLQDNLHTICDHIAVQIASVINAFNGKSTDKLLITGGGAFNPAITDAIKKHCNIEVVIPFKNIIEFKEAMIFAFLGVLFKRDENNVLSKVTGALRDHTGGALYKK